MSFFPFVDSNIQFLSKAFNKVLHLYLVSEPGFSINKIEHSDSVFVRLHSASKEDTDCIVITVDGACWSNGTPEA